MADNQALEADPNYQDDESLPSDNASSTASITSSILAYRKIHGRTFHSFKTDTEYWGPNDEAQNEGLDITHQVLLQALDDRLFLAPIGPNPERVIDIGTGTGIWATDFADQFPAASVIGTDLSPIQPSWVPPNCRFELDDAAVLPWPYPDNHFDLIHLRSLMGSIPDWPALYKEAYRCVKPGGWIEHLDFDISIVSDDDSIGPNSVWKRWGPLFYECGEKMGRTFRVVTNHESVGWANDAGFENVEEHGVKLPLGGWPADKKWKQVGLLNLAATENGLEGYALYMLTKVLGWEYNEVQLFLVEARKELKNRSVHAYFRAVTVFGQKPGLKE